MAVDSSAESIAEYHLSLGWAGIGYHYLVHWGGRIEYVGDIATARANVYGLNPQVVGVCIPGDWMHQLPPEPALVSLNLLLRYLVRLLPGREIVGHRDIALPASPTDCPGPLLVAEMEARL